MSPRPSVTIAIPCRTDEPALGRTLEAAWASATDAGVTTATLVCLNGPGGDASSASAQLVAAAARTGRTMRTVDVDAAGRLEATGDAHELVVLRTRRPGKAIAWNWLRGAVATDVVVFLDADVSLGPHALGRLLAALAAAPDAILASPKTACAARPTFFERIMAAPYGVDFPNLSGQLYAARVAGLPARMPDDLIEPERWLELAIGAAHMVREPEALVVVRLPGSLRDFYRQRIRIEMGKVQLERDYPELASRGNTQPRLRTAITSLGVAELLRLGAYLALRESAHAVARRRYGRQTTADAWVQAGSTKEWTS
jgi:glycosyl transferase family 2